MMIDLSASLRLDGSQMAQISVERLVRFCIRPFDKSFVETFANFIISLKRVVESLISSRWRDCTLLCL